MTVSRRATVIAAVVFVAGLAVIGVVIASAIPDSTPAPSDGYGAELACEGYVKDRLPGATDFTNEAFTGAPPTWVVTGTAKSPTVTSLVLNYRCTVTSPDGTNWTLKSLQDLGN